MLAWIYGPALVAHASRARDPHVFNDDVRNQIFAFYRYADSDLFAGDALSDYFLALSPQGYRWLYAAGSALWDAAALSKVLPYVLLSLLLTAAALATHRIAGQAAAFGTLALALGSQIFLLRMAGGLARAFAFPIVAGSLAALVYGNAWWLAALVTVGAAFYPVTAVMGGLSLAGLMALPASLRGQASGWSGRKRLGLLAATALVAMAIVAPTAIRLSRWGPPLTPEMSRDYPEAGPGGRLSGVNLPPYHGYLAASPRVLRATLMGAGEPLAPPLSGWLEAGQGVRRDRLLAALLVLVAVGWAFLIARRPASSRVLLLPAAACVAYYVARAVAPFFFLPDRYVQHSIPVLAIVALPAAFAGLWPAPGGRRWASRLAPALALASTVLVLAALGGRGSPDAGLNVVVTEDERAITAAITALPKSALVAGWPTTLDSMPYLARRAALLTFETHLPYHRRFAELCRQRMEALIDAYFATSLEPLLRLRDRLGVTHLLVQPSHLRGHPPGYFRPFDQRIARALAAARGQPFEIERQLAAASVSAVGDYVLLDLSRLTR